MLKLPAIPHLSTPTNITGIHKRKQRSRHPAILQLLEPRVLFTAAHSAADISGMLSLTGMDKVGVISFDGVSAITAGNWIDQTGTTTLVNPGSASAYSVLANGVVNLSLATNPSGSGVISNSLLSGNINATNDVVALNELSAGVPLANGLDLLVNHAGSFTTSNLAGLWNISALDFRGTVSINASGAVTGGQLFLESGQQSAAVTGGAATLGANGVGTLNLTTGFTGSFSAVALNLTMDSVKDTAAGTATTFGNGSASSELTVLTKSSGTYAASDVVNTTWALNSAQGDGSFTFHAGNVLSGSLTDTSGTAWTISGNYTLGGNGTMIANLNLKNGTNSHRESLFGAINPTKNLMALDRAIANGDNGPNLTILTHPANHAPTDRLTAVLPGSAFHAIAFAVDFPTLLAATSASDLDHDTLSFLITDVPTPAGTLSITHNGSTSAVIPGTTLMVNGDTLTWVPSATLAGQVNAFSVSAFDGTAHAANPSKIFIATSALPIITITAKKGNALESEAGTAAGDGTFQLQRSGGDLTQPLTVTLGITGNAVDGVNYTLLGPDNATLSTSTTVTFPANAQTITLTVAPLQDNTADPTLNVTATVLPDPNASASAYLPSIHASGVVKILDSSPTVLVVPVVNSVKEGDSNVLSFYVERLPAQGGNVNSSLTVTLDYTSSTFSLGHLVAPTSVTFNPGDVKKRIFISTTDDGLATGTESIVATLVGSNFDAASGEGSAAVSVIDTAPTVRIMNNINSAQESDPVNKFGEFTVLRTGSTTSSLTVALSVAGGAGFGTLGTNYTLVDANNTTLTNSVTIPAGASSIVVKVIPIDDGKNDPTLLASVSIVADAGPSYHIATANTALVRILNNNRFPTVANGTVQVATAKDTALHLSFATLVTDTGAALATGETNGTLLLQVGKVLSGHLRILRSGASTPVAATNNMIINPGDELIWTPATGVTGASIPAFTLFAHDGTLESLTASLFEATVT